MKKFCLFLFVVIGLSLLSTGCSEERAFKRIRFLMGTPAEITVVAKDKKSAYEAIDAAFSEIRRIEQLMSRHKPESALSRLNQRAGEESVETDRELLYLIAESIRLSRLSRGAFDITVAPLIEAYGFNKAIEGDFTLPSREEIAKSLDLVGSDKIIIDDENNRVRFSLPGMKLDLGGIAKGYAVDRAIEVLKQREIDKALVNLGGNIFALSSPREKGWQIGMQHPEIKDRIWAKIELKGEAVATSGDYERFFTAKGKRYGHIINPKTGRPAGAVLSATIVASSALEADGLSTAVFVLGAQEGMELIESIDGVEGVIITKDREDPRLIKQLVSKGLKERLLHKERRYSRLW